MSKSQYLKNVEREIMRLNRMIDRKILSGLGYGDEARRHKRLLGLTRELRRRPLIDRLGNLFRNQYVR